MKRSIVNMTNWTVYVYDKRYNLSGTGDYHPSLGRNVYIARTSTLEEAHIENDILIYITKNTEYHCPLKYINIENPYFNVVESYLDELALLDKDSDYCLDKLISGFARIAKKDESEPNEFWKHIFEIAKDGKKELEIIKKDEKDRLLSIVSQYENSIYLEVSVIADGDILAYNVDGNKDVVEPYLHVGMFQDSVLYCTDTIDFRYFPKGNKLEIYSISENIKTIVIKNMKEYKIYFNSASIEPNETKVFMAEEFYKGE